MDDALSPVRRRRFGAEVAALAAERIDAVLARYDAVKGDAAVREHLARVIDERWRGPRDHDLVRRFLAAAPLSGRLWLHGGGTHTAAIIDTLRAKPGLALLGILDKAAEPGERRFGLPLIRPEALTGEDPILLSHQEFEPQMRRTLAGLGVAPARIRSIYDDPAYLAGSWDAFELLDLPAAAENIIVTFLPPENQLVPDAELATLLDPAATLRLYLGRPHLDRPSEVYRGVSLRQSAGWLAAALERLRPKRILIRSSFQFNSAAWVAWLRRRRPEARIVVELYDWAFTLPDALMRGQFLYDEAELADEKLAEMAALADADAVIHKYGGRHWQRFDGRFRPRTLQAFPVVGRGGPAPERPPRRPGPLRLVSAGALPPESFVRRFAPEYTLFDPLSVLARALPVEIDVFNILDRPGMDPALFESYRQAWPSYPLRYNPAVPFAEMQRRLRDYDFGLLALTFDFAEFRLMDAVCVGNKFLSYVGAGLPVICSSDDIYTAALVRRFNAGVIVPRDALPDLARLLAAADLPAMRRGILHLRAFMQAGNRRLMTRLTAALYSDDARPGASA